MKQEDFNIPCWKADGSDKNELGLAGGQTGSFRCAKKLSEISHFQSGWHSCSGGSLIKASMQFELVRRARIFKNRKIAVYVHLKVWVKSNEKQSGWSRKKRIQIFSLFLTSFPYWSPYNSALSSTNCSLYIFWSKILSSTTCLIKQHQIKLSVVYHEPYRVLGALMAVNRLKMVYFIICTNNVLSQGNFWVRSTRNMRQLHKRQFSQNQSGFLNYHMVSTMTNIIFNLAKGDFFSWNPE